MKIQKLEDVLKALLEQQHHELDSLVVDSLQVRIEVQGEMDSDDDLMRRQFRADLGASINDIKTNPKLRLEDITIWSR